MAESDEKLQEIIKSLSDERLITTKGETIHCTKKGFFEYFKALMDIYKKDEATFKENLKQSSENAMARVLVRIFPKIEYDECILYHRLLCGVYPIKKLINSFMEDKLYNDVSFNVERIMRKQKVPLTRAFSILGKEIGYSTSWVRDHYTPVDTT